jgi:hypothetical protein
VDVNVSIQSGRRRGDGECLWQYEKMLCQNSLGIPLRRRNDEAHGTGVVATVGALADVMGQDLLCGDPEGEQHIVAGNCQRPYSGPATWCLGKKSGGTALQGVERAGYLQGTALRSGQSGWWVWGCSRSVGSHAALYLEKRMIRALDMMQHLRSLDASTLVVAHLQKIAAWPQALYNWV